MSSNFYLIFVSFGVKLVICVLTRKTQGYNDKKKNDKKTVIKGVHVQIWKMYGKVIFHLKII